ncbi:hypothetical protein ACFQO4_20595 [Saliphagus sp. GCM10025334]
MTKKQPWHENVEELIENRPDSILSRAGLTERFGETDEEGCYYILHSDSSVTSDDMEWLLNNFEGHVKVNGAYAGELQIRFSETKLNFPTS